MNSEKFLPGNAQVSLQHSKTRKALTSLTLPRNINERKESNW
nr:MAG TPA: hypothetical protein [Caudoviricetes sp.]